MTDEELVILAQRGDGAAMEQLYHRYKNMVRLNARPYFLISGDRDDLIQEGMIGLYKAVRDYAADKNAAFATFAELCVARQIKTALRTSNRQKHMPLNNYVSLYSPAGKSEARELIETIGDTGDIEDDFISRETVQTAFHRLDKSLTVLERNALELFLQGLTYREIAEKAGCSKKSVDNALSRVKTKLGKILAEEE